MTEDDRPSTSPTLGSLTSGYVAEHHETYLRHLQNAVLEGKNLNIALTGPYGSGKSSVLDQFAIERKRPEATLRVAISTLGPDLEGSDRMLTNRIQKELVKQLLYRAAPREMPFSRFNRIVPLSTTRATVEATLAVAVVAGFLSLLGWLPRLKWTGQGNPWWVGTLSAVGFALLAVAVLATLRKVIYGLVVSDISAAGATVKLSPQAATYFDEYLDEIVYFFDTKLPEIVIFEDLDRFDDPQIFEALRELNTLLNHTARRRKKKKPLRFVYAIKDSLFESLGTDPDHAPHDAAYAETVRANRTKFFDIVIPMVPFISHRNARELLDSLLSDADLRGIDRRLIALVAESTTDMRLLKNIRNEYTVFAERLLLGNRTAPGLSAGNLFALVVYKNLHLKDFELISRRESDLDRLYEHHRDLVRKSIDDRERRKRELLDEPAKAEARAPLAKELGDRLVAVGHALKHMKPNLRGWPSVQFDLADSTYIEKDVHTCDFWHTVAATDKVSVTALFDNSGQREPICDLDHDQLRNLFPESVGVEQWKEIDEQAHRTAVDRTDREILFLRGADFKDLTADGRYTLGSETFAEIVSRTLKSELARKLVNEGYLDRNFALYAAQFYGDFTGVDVATFLVRSVQPNRMNIDHEFSGPEAIANLLHEAPGDFPRTVSAYNIQVLDYLLAHKDERAAAIATTIANDFGDDAREFLRAFLNAETRHVDLVALLSGLPWPAVFTYLVHDEGIPGTIRPALVDAALAGSAPDGIYELDAEVSDFIADHYAELSVLTMPQPDSVITKVARLLTKAVVVLPSLEGLAETVRDYVVGGRLYSVTADNLRRVLGAGDISLDRVCLNEHVWAYCIEVPNQYLTAVENDSETRYAISSAGTLTATLDATNKRWDKGQVLRLAALAAPESALEHLDSAPKRHFPALAAHCLFKSNVRNVVTYLDEAGGIDQSLADLIVRAGSIAVDTAADDDSETEDRLRVAVHVLNAADTIPDPRARVDLVRSLDLDRHVPPAQLTPEPGVLLSLLLDDDLVDDSAETFLRFREAGWSTIRLAVTRSSKFAEFMTPELVHGFVAELFDDQLLPSEALDRIIDDLSLYVPDDDPAALFAAGEYAWTSNRELPGDQIHRIAAVTRDATLVLRILDRQPQLPTVTEVVTLLSSLGEPYSLLTSRDKPKFEVPNDGEHQRVFDYLKREGAISNVTKAPHRNSRIVKL